MRVALLLVALLAVIACDKPPTRSEVDILKVQISVLIDRCNELDQKVQGLESELEEAKSACEANACDCPGPTVNYSYYTAPAWQASPKP